MKMRGLSWLSVPVLAILIISMVALVFASCAEPAPATPAPTTPAPATPTPATPTPTTPQPSEVTALQLRFATNLPPVSAQVKLYEEWIQKIGEATEGGVKIDIYPAESLIQGEDMISGTKSGLTDIGEINILQSSDQLPLTATLTLPFIPVKDVEEFYKMWLELEDKFPEMKAEHGDFKVLCYKAFMGSQLHTTEGPLQVPDDIKGKKLFGAGIIAQFTDSLGGTAVQLPLPDWFTSLDRGLLQGMWLPADGVVELKLDQYLRHHIVFPTSAQTGMTLVVMNSDSWNKLPISAQKEFDDLSFWLAEETRRVVGEAADGAIATMKATGEHTIAELTLEEQETWYDAALPVHEEFLNELEAAGLPARDIYEEMIQLTK